MYDDTFPENKQMKLAMREITQQSDEKVAIKRVRIMDFRWRSISASRPLFALLHIAKQSRLETLRPSKVDENFHLMPFY